jgi:hypothetical protein
MVEDLIFNIQYLQTNAAILDRKGKSPNNNINRQMKRRRRMGRRRP